MAYREHRRHESKSMIMPIVGLAVLVFGMYMATQFESGVWTMGWNSAAKTNTKINLINSSPERRSLDLKLVIDGEAVYDDILKSGYPFRTDLQLDAGSHRIQVSSLEAEVRKDEQLTIEVDSLSHQLSIYYREQSTDFVKRENKKRLDKILGERRKVYEDDESLSPDQRRKIIQDDSIKTVLTEKNKPQYSFEEKDLHIDFSAN